MLLTFALELLLVPVVARQMINLTVVIIDLNDYFLGRQIHTLDDPGFLEFITTQFTSLRE